MHSPGGEVPPSREPADDPSSIVGRPISELDTPALCVDLDTMKGLRIGVIIQMFVLQFWYGSPYPPGMPRVWG